MPKRRWSDENLASAIRTSISWRQVYVALGLQPGGGTHSSLKSRADELGLSTEHFLGQAWSSGRELCRSGTPLESLLVEGSEYKTSHLRLRLIKDGIKEARCERCNLDSWQGEKIPLELDHKNGIKNDHRLENLQILCANCHGLTPTWRGRNIGRVVERNTRRT